MAESDWSSYYQSHPDGRCLITGAALVAFGLKHRDRLVETSLWGLPSTILLLDRPMKLGEKVADSEVTEYTLRRIRLIELPGWPPRVAAGATGTPPFLECRLKSVALVPGSTRSQDGLLLTLEFEGAAHNAWLVGCPTPLLEAVKATLNQKGCAGLRMYDLQDMRLVGA